MLIDNERLIELLLRDFPDLDDAALLDKLVEYRAAILQSLEMREAMRAAGCGCCQ